MISGVSIIIVNYKTSKLVFDLINSILKFNKKYDYEIIVIDNNSEKKPNFNLQKIEINWNCLDSNNGFGYANNIGLSKATKEMVLFLNPDTLFTDDSLDRSVDFYIKNYPENKFGFLGCRLTNFQGDIQRSSYFRYPGLRCVWEESPLYSKIYKKKKTYLSNTIQKHNENHFAKWVCGAFLLIHKPILLENNLKFNDIFFLYSEEVELCARLNKLGYKHFYYKDSSLIHFEGNSSKLMSTKKSAQIIASELLSIKLIHGFFYFFIYLIFSYFNLLLTSLLTFRSNKKINNFLILKKKILLSYGLKILFHKKFYKNKQLNLF